MTTAVLARIGEAGRRTRPIWIVYAGLGVLLLAYLVSLTARGGGGSSELLDGWLVAAFETVGAGLCLARAVRVPGHRSVPLALGLATLSWAAGDWLLTLESSGGRTPPTPSLADLLYLAFYPMMYAALLLILRRQVRDLTGAMWLDGLVAGLGAAGLTACFAFAALVRSSDGDPAAVAVNLAYPIGDLLLLALVVGGSAMLPSRRNAQWALLAVACLVNGVGDTANLFKDSGVVGGAGTIVDGVAWPTSILLISLSMWLPTRRGGAGVVHKPPGLVLPAAGALAGLAILLFAAFRRVSDVAIVLATATLLTAGFRQWLSLGHLRTLTHKRHGQAITDELTGLGNRRQLFYLLNDFFFSSQADPREPSGNLGLLFIDLNHFKEINDSFGHAAGDDLLRQVGPRLSSALRDSDTLVRVGGDELAVLVTNATTEYTVAVAQRLVAKLNEPFLLGAVSVRISASIGIASAPTDASDGAGLLRCADLAMYRAKLRASAYEVYSKDIDDDDDRLRLVDELRTAVEQQQLLLHYQPQVDLRTGQVVAVEALLRWPHPRLGLVPPLDFLPLAEEAGLMPAITAWVVAEALGQCAAWREDGQYVAMSVNASVSNLVDGRFLDLLGDALDRHHLPGSALTVEITETTIISDFESCQRAIAQLRDLGIHVSVDDFGAGFTSLAYLGSLAVSELKLDRAFITGLSGDGAAPALVQATIELGHALGLRVVAEGIEDRAMLTLLADFGCDLAQGYFIGRPVLAGELSLDPVQIADPLSLGLRSAAV